MLGARLAQPDPTAAYALAGAGVGTVYAAMADATAAIQARADAAASAGETLVLRGWFRIDGTVTFACNLDARGCRFVGNDPAIAPMVRVGTTVAGVRIGPLSVALPEIVYGKTIGGGWTAGGVGVELANLWRCRLWLPLVSAFATGLLMTTYGGVGTEHNVMTLGALWNNKVNHKLAPGDTNGWVNENEFLGGDFRHESAEGTAVVGTRHVLVSAVGTSQPNNNLWVKPSLQSPGVVEYEIESIGGIYNRWVQGRYEHTGGNPAVSWNQLDATRVSRNNVIDGGYNAEAIVQTRSANSVGNRVSGSRREWIDGSVSAPNAVIEARNSASSTAGYLHLYDSATHPSDASGANWAWEWASAHLKCKGTANAVERLKITQSTGMHEWGDGVNPVDVNLYRGGANQIKTDDRLVAADGLTTKTKAGTPTDADFQTAPSDGTIVVDTTALKLWVRMGGVWKQTAALT